MLEFSLDKLSKWQTTSFLTLSLRVLPAPYFPWGRGWHLCMSVDAMEETRQREGPAFLSAHRHEDRAAHTLLFQWVDLVSQITVWRTV